MLWNDILNFVIKNGFNFLLVLALVLIIYILKRYAKLLYLFRYCRKLARLYNGNVRKTRPLFLRIFFKFKEADIKISFSDKDLYVMFIRIKPKTTIRFIDANTIERIRYRKAIPLGSHDKGLTPGSGYGYAIRYAQSSEVTPKSSTTTFNFNYNSDALGLILFTENPSEMFVFDRSRNNYNVIGDGEMAYSRYIGGRSFIKKWIGRNN